MVVGWRRERFNILLLDAKGVVVIERRVLYHPHTIEAYPPKS